MLLGPLSVLHFISVMFSLSHLFCISIFLIYIFLYCCYSIHFQSSNSYDSGMFIIINDSGMFIIILQNVYHIVVDCTSLFHVYYCSRVCIISSVPGRHTGATKSMFGHLKLRKVYICLFWRSESFALEISGARWMI